jgi:hypothetical protein
MRRGGGARGRGELCGGAGGVAGALARRRAKLGAMIESITPILRVESLARSRAFYVDKLGFALDWTAEGMTSVSRDGRAIMLCERAQG